MIGTVTNEGTFFVDGKVKASSDLIPGLTYLLPFLTQNDFERIFKAYPTTAYSNDVFLQAAVCFR
jgi:hypothetical protein